MPITYGAPRAQLLGLVDRDWGEQGGRCSCRAEHYAITAEFCERYDQASFDLDYPTEPIEVFEPMVGRVFAEPRYLPPGWVLRRR